MIATFYGVHDNDIRTKLMQAVPSIGAGFGFNNGNWANGGKGVLDIGVIGGVFKEPRLFGGPNAVEGPIPEGYAFGNQSTGYIRTRKTSRVSQSSSRRRPTSLGSSVT